MPAQLHLAPARTCTHPESDLIILDSALYQRLISIEDAHTIVENAPARKQKILRRFTHLAYSGSETRVRNFLQSLQVSVLPQAHIPSVGN
ncbi:hypothetical protein [Arcanobacterium haemolyticum]|uniref:hypothetical protein n=1 Tax=Arcanobacterium haemolyticum TaxID=28264 RepID=UPI001110CF39|nr:hypothetical protein [Arcanobacterium haemolyticum]